MNRKPIRINPKMRGVFTKKAMTRGLTYNSIQTM